MTEPDIDAALRALPHFRSVPLDLVAQIVPMTRILRPEAGEVLFRQGEPCSAFYAIQTGSVKLYRVQMDGREHVVNHIVAGATFAEAALLSLRRFPVNAMVMQPSTVLLQIGGEDFLELFRSDARLAPAMIGSLCARLASLVGRVEELSIVQAGARLAHWLLRQQAQGTDEPVIELSLAKKDLAAHLAMTPETLSRLLGRWQDEGWIHNERSAVVLRDARPLLALADGESDTA